MSVVRLVADEPIADVAAEARSFADAIEDGQLGKVNSATNVLFQPQLAITLA